MSIPPAGPPAQREREGSLEAPTRHPLAWRTEAFYDSGALEKELERVFDICHGCRRCFSLCNAFPTLFDAVDATAEGEVAALDRKVFWEVVDNCYLCDMCFMTKCPYVPPHPFNVDFPHLMLRAKAVRVRATGLKLSERVLAATDTVGRLAGIPVVVEAVNALNTTRVGRALLEKTLGVDRTAPLPVYHARSARRRLAALGTVRQGVRDEESDAPRTTAGTTGKVALFTTCYGNRNEPELDEDLVAVFEHNGIEMALLGAERCCGMPRLELGDLAGVAKLKEANIPQLAAAVAAGYDIVAPVPSCVLMFKQELPLMYPEDAQVRQVARRVFDPFEYLMLRHAAGALRTDFTTPLGKVSYHVPCHLRVQNIGLKTRDVLRLVPGTTVEAIERCSGHNGTYGLKARFRAASVRIGRPVVQRVAAGQCDHYASDCPMAGHQIESGLAGGRAPEHPLRLLRRAYGIA
ncbi:MAG TPA: heterodisulfide reductase-related iron-sulfur binding cluster [Steroidobacteraceae bacterium]|jgi:Fe-S oxidoreductase|nr:heterodisulfide reductase-related iron-sulfur binding cluster [Steroidobacteraceae bacterium]